MKESLGWVPGDTVWVRGIAKPLHEIQEPWLLSRNVVGTMSLDRSDTAVLARGPVYWQWASNWRKSFLGFADRTLGSQAPIVHGLCFNVVVLEEELAEGLRRAGVYHIVSASGLHAMLFASACAWILSRLPLPPFW
jgi:predicted membrane metal-binding protein